jgi:hypothetical protein
VQPGTATQTFPDPRPDAALRDEQDGLLPPSGPAWMSAASNRILSVCFIIFLFTPLLGFVFGRAGSISKAENRALAPRPVFGVDPLKSLPGKIESWYADRFGFRSSLIRLYSTVVFRFLKSSNNDDLIIGKNGWIFYARDNIFEDFLGLSPFTDDELRRWRDYLVERSQLLAKQNTRYLFVIGPDKNTVYPEDLPDYIQDHRGRSRLQQLLEYLRVTRADVSVLDLHEALRRAKPQGALFFPQDTHWNGRGFFVAYQAMVRALSRWFPDMTPQELGESYTLRSQVATIGDWGRVGFPERNLTYASEFLVPTAALKAHQALVPPLPRGVHPYPEPWRQPLLWVGPGQRKLMLFHDSYMRVATMGPQASLTYFFAGYQPLAEHFASTFMFGNTSEDEEQILIRQFHPDVVIEEFAERVLGSGVPRRRRR